MVIKIMEKNLKTFKYPQMKEMWPHEKFYTHKYPYRYVEKTFKICIKLLTAVIPG